MELWKKRAWRIAGHVHAYKLLGVLLVLATLVE
jgi:hypothetical protein